MTNNIRTVKCDCCGKFYSTDSSQEEMQQEFVANFKCSPEDMDTGEICDDCYNMVQTEIGAFTGAVQR